MIFVIAAVLCLVFGYLSRDATNGWTVLLFPVGVVAAAAASFGSSGYTETTINGNYHVVSQSKVSEVQEYGDTYVINTAAGGKVIDNVDVVFGKPQLLYMCWDSSYIVIPWHVSHCRYQLSIGQR